MNLFLGIILFALGALLIFIPFGRNLSWRKEVRQQQNIALYRQQMAHNPSAELATELGQRLLNDEQTLQKLQVTAISSKDPKWCHVASLLWLMLIIVPLAYYFSLNRYHTVQQGEQAFQQKQEQLHQASASERNDDYVLSLQQKLRKAPNDPELWLELGQAYVLNNEFENGLTAYANAEKINGSQPAILGLAATALYYQAGQRITPKVRQLIDIALQQDPFETSSLSLLASDSFLTNDYASALKFWQQLLDSERSEVDHRKTIESMRMAEILLKANNHEKSTL